ncbi:MAG: RNA-binding protein [Armatimonadota bacterium]|nr:RNA-binding protein [Armatimonadota bacterium]
MKITRDQNPSKREASEMAVKSLYVGNLPYTSTEEEIRVIFEPFGPIEDIRLIHSKGFGFVDIPEENVAAAIEATNGMDVGGRTITVNEARQRTERRSQGRGGFSGGRRERW